MNFATLAVLTLAMTADAFAAALVNGARDRLRGRQILRAAALFAAVETAMLLAGWAAGHAAAHRIAAWDHWLAFALLTALGGKMVWENLKKPNETTRPAVSGSLWLTAAAALGTGVDSMIGGAGLAFAGAPVWTAAAMLAAATLLMTAAGMALGRLFGHVAGRYAGIFGGIVLVSVGASILLQHLQAA